MLTCGVVDQLVLCMLCNIPAAGCLFPATSVHGGCHGYLDHPTRLEHGSLHRQSMRFAFESQGLENSDAWMLCGQGLAPSNSHRLLLVPPPPSPSPVQPFEPATTPTESTAVSNLQDQESKLPDKYCTFPPPLQERRLRAAIPKRRPEVWLASD